MTTSTKRPTLQEIAENVLDNIGAQLELELEIANLQSAIACLSDSSTLAEVRLSLQDMEESAKSLLSEIRKAKTILKTVTR